MKGTGTLKSLMILLVIVLGLSLSAALVITVRSLAAAIQGDCITTVIEGDSGFVNQTWEAAPEGGACLILQINEPEGVFNIEAGWVFTAPLVIDGEIITTSIVEGQIAPQIDPISFDVVSGTEMIVEPTWNPPGTEIGFWWSYSPAQNEECVVADISGPSGFVHQTWPAGQNKACLELHMDEPESGIFEISSGWVFTAPLQVDGNVIPTRFVSGELAPQIDPISFEVVTDTVLILEPTINPPGTEVGFWWNYVENQPPVVSFKTYLPIVTKPKVILEQEIDLYESSNLQVKTASWPGAAPEQEACMIVNFKGTSSQALIESGWFFGSSITRAELNGVSINLITLPPPPGEEAKQISSLLLNNTPRNLQICIVGINPGLEIGLRFRYPAP